MWRELCPPRGALSSFPAGPGRMRPMIALREVTKRFGATAALDAVSLEVPAATTHVLL